MVRVTLLRLMGLHYSRLVSGNIHSNKNIFYVYNGDRGLEDGRPPVQCSTCHRNQRASPRQILRREGLSKRTGQLLQGETATRTRRRRGSRAAPRLIFSVFRLSSKHNEAEMIQSPRLLMKITLMFNSLSYNSHLKNYTNYDRTFDFS